MKEIEKRVECLEDLDKERKEAMEANPVATKAEVEELWDEFEDLENHNSHNNLQFVWIPEGKEGGDMTVWTLFRSIPNWDETRKLMEIQRVPRSPRCGLTQGGTESDPGTLSLCSGDRELIMATAPSAGIALDP